MRTVRNELSSLVRICALLACFTVLSSTATLHAQLGGVAFVSRPPILLDPGRDQRVTTIEFSPDGQFLAVGVEDQVTGRGRVIFYRRAGTQAVVAGEIPLGNSTPISLSFSPYNITPSSDAPPPLLAVGARQRPGGASPLTVWRLSISGGNVTAQSVPLPTELATPPVTVVQFSRRFARLGGNDFGSGLLFVGRDVGGRGTLVALRYDFINNGVVFSPLPGDIGPYESRFSAFDSSPRNSLGLRSDLQLLAVGFDGAPGREFGDYTSGVFQAFIPTGFPNQVGPARVPVKSVEFSPNLQLPRDTQGFNQRLVVGAGPNSVLYRLAVGSGTVFFSADNRVFFGEWASFSPNGRLLLSAGTFGDTNSVSLYVLDVSATELIVRQYIFSSTPDVQTGGAVVDAEFAPGYENGRTIFAVALSKVVCIYPNVILQGDSNCDCVIDNVDLLSVLFSFGQSGVDLQADLNGDGTVNNADLLIVLFSFGDDSTGLGCVRLQP